MHREVPSRPVPTRRDVRGATEVITALVIAALSAVVVFAPTAAPAASTSSDLESLERPTRGFGDYQVRDLKLVYHGRPPLIRRPGVVRSDVVYMLIPEYREIRASGISSSNPKYHFLMRKASQKFVRAVKTMARKHGHDCVVEAGGITIANPGADTPPDRTNQTIHALQR